MTYQEIIRDHYENVWGNNSKIYLWDKGPFEKLPFDFRVLEFSPTSNRHMWTYATCCMSQPDDDSPIEVHIFSSKQDLSIIELLTSVAFYHRNTYKFDLWHTMNFGRSWQDASICNYGFISLPYLDGTVLENLESDNIRTKFYWLIPISEAEVTYKTKFGEEMLEQKFDEKELDYLNPNRVSVV